MQTIAARGGHCWTLVGIAGRWWALLDVGGHCWTLVGNAERCWALLDVGGHCWTLVGIAGRWMFKWLDVGCQPTLRQSAAIPNAVVVALYPLWRFFLCMAASGLYVCHYGGKQRR